MYSAYIFVTYVILGKYEIMTLCLFRESLVFLSILSLTSFCITLHPLHDKSPPPFPHFCLHNISVLLFPNSTAPPFLVSFYFLVPMAILYFIFTSADLELKPERRNAVFVFLGLSYCTQYNMV